MTILKHIIAIIVLYFISMESGIVTTIAIGLIYGVLECQRFVNEKVSGKLNRL